MKPIRHQIITKDGSSTLRIEELKESYHSKHGAVVESKFVYLDEGLKYWREKQPKKRCRILELGYGTGLMTYLIFLYSLKNTIKIAYESLEAFPLNADEINTLNYEQYFQKEKTLLHFKEFNNYSWENKEKISPFFSLTKKEIKFENFASKSKFDLIFYDAFGSHAQPELWSLACMFKCYELLNNGGVWVSYCAKGSVRRALEHVGFKTYRLPGPPGKREMLRAIKY